MLLSCIQLTLSHKPGGSLLVITLLQVDQYQKHCMVTEASGVNSLPKQWYMKINPASYQLL